MNRSIILFLSNFTKQSVKVMPDRGKYFNLGDVSRFKLPASDMIDFRTMSIFSDVRFSV
jgi:hypothetical protein